MIYENPSRDFPQPSDNLTSKRHPEKYQHPYDAQSPLGGGSWTPPESGKQSFRGFYPQEMSAQEPEEKTNPFFQTYC